jgi:hypothetical protein
MQRRIAMSDRSARQKWRGEATRIFGVYSIGCENNLVAIASAFARIDAILRAGDDPIISVTKQDVKGESDMTVTTVRVTRSYKQSVSEYVDVSVAHDEGAQSFSIETRAEQLVKAQMDCGHDIAWEEKSCVRENYPAQTVKAEILTSEVTDERPNANG